MHWFVDSALLEVVMRFHLVSPSFIFSLSDVSFWWDITVFYWWFSPFILYGFMLMKLFDMIFFQPFFLLNLRGLINWICGQEFVNFFGFFQRFCWLKDACLRGKIKSVKVMPIPQCVTWDILICVGQGMQQEKNVIWKNKFSGIYWGVRVFGGYYCLVKQAHLVHFTRIRVI